MNTVEDVKKYVDGIGLTRDEKELFRYLLSFCAWNNGQFSFAIAETETVVDDAVVLDESKAARKIFAKPYLFKRLWKKLCPFQNNQFGEYVSHSKNWCGEMNAMFIRQDVFWMFEEWALNEYQCFNGKENTEGRVTEKLVSYEVAKLLKQIGFRWSCDYVWYEKLPAANTSVKELIGKTRTDKFYYTEEIGTPSVFANYDYIPSYIKGEVYAAPTLQMAHEWLRTELGFYVVVEPYANISTNSVCYMYNVYKLDGGIGWLYSVEGYKNHNDAMQDAFKNILEKYIKEQEDEERAESK